MSRPMILAVLLLCVPVVPAFATQQVEERIVVGGRVYRTPVTPLRPLLDKLGRRIEAMQPQASNLWRGYVGTWMLEDDRLYLVSMMRYAYEEREGSERPLRVEKDIPLSTVFGDQPGPIPATWWSGQLMIPQGRLLRHGYPRRDTLYEMTLYLKLEKGRVVTRRLVDNRKEGRGLSYQDTQWVTSVAEPRPDDGQWHDARSIRTEAFQKAVPQGTRFRTRGYLAVIQQFPPCLVVHLTPATVPVRIELRIFPEAAEVRSCPHAEVTATWEREGTDTVLRVASWRALEAGETMHHPDFVVPELPAPDLPAPGSEPDPNLGMKLNDADHLHDAFGCMVSLRGALVRDEVATIHGVEVEPDEALDGKSVVASGLLEKWVVTKRLIERDPEVKAIFGRRGPGTWYRLVHPRTGRLSRARTRE